MADEVVPAPDPEPDSEEEAAAAREDVVWLDRWQQLGVAFSPATPITSRDLLAGRIRQLGDLFDVARQAGQHSVVYGERGVGKTSLATVTASLMESTMIVVRVNCYASDTFTTVWAKVLDEIKLSRKLPGIGFHDLSSEVVETASTFLGVTDPSPEDVRKALQVLGGVAPVLVIIDEFDRLSDAPATALFADTIKALSDHQVRATIILVGVADNVDQLVAEHRSVERAMVQIHMPRMSVDELAKIVTIGLDTVEMEIDEQGLRLVTSLSQGLPHYTHQLALLASRHAVQERTELVVRRHVDAAIADAIKKAQESILDTHHRAIMSSRPNMYGQVLLACAVAEADDRGFFAASDVRGPLSTIMGRNYDIPAYAKHLNDFSTDTRGNVLQQIGRPRSYRYRFSNPLLQPFVIMRGISSGLLSADTLGQVRASLQSSI